MYKKIEPTFAEVFGAYVFGTMGRPDPNTYKRFKRTRFIRTKHNINIFGVIPFIKLQKLKKNVLVSDCFMGTHFALRISIFQTNFAKFLGPIF